MAIWAGYGLFGRLIILTTTCVRFQGVGGNGERPPGLGDAELVRFLRWIGVRTPLDPLVEVVVDGEILET